MRGATVVITQNEESNCLGFGLYGKGELMTNTRYKIFFASLVYLVSSFSYAGTALDVATKYYQQHDKNGGKKEPKLVGLRIDALIQAKKYTAAQKLLEEQLKNGTIPKAIVHWRLAILAALRGKYADVKKHLEQTQSLPLLRNPEAARSLYAMLPAREKDWFVKQLSEMGFFASKPESVCPYFELEKRKKRADFLWLLKKNHPLSPEISDAIYKELYVFLPEVIPASDLATDKGFGAFLSSRTLDEVKKRIDYLFLFGKNDEVRKTISAHTKDVELSASALCDLRYEDAKVDRKLRNYAEARKKFVAIGKDADCLKETNLKARYMNLMLASMKSDDSVLDEFDSFVADYPKHSFADDVLLFKASILFHKNDIQEALKELDKIITLYPKGDMIERALFQKAFTLAKLKQTATALTTLEVLKKISGKESLEYAQASYWLARLAIFDDVKDTTTTNKSQRKKVKKALYDLVQSKNPTVYSWLSLLLLESLGEAKKKWPKPTVADSAIEFRNDPDLLVMEKLVRYGFRTESLLLLEDLPVSSNDVAKASAMAYFYTVLNRPEAGHQKLVRCDASLANRLQQKIPATYARISYPRPFLQEVSKAASRHVVPTSVVFSIMRQESGFLEKSQSWANARGLMQLMYDSAKTQAKKCKLTNLSEDDLYQPEINILLGTSLIQKYWQDFGTIAVALAAYNAGEHAAKNWLKKNDGAPIDTFIEEVSYKETRNYVKHVLGSMWIYSQSQGEKNLPQLQIKSAVAAK